MTSISSIATGLVADIGGTNARFALVADRGGARQLIEPRTLRTADYEILPDAVAAYVAAVGLDAPPRRAVLAVAGAARGDDVRVTNCPWHFSIAATRVALGLDDLAVINDFAANGWALTELLPEDLSAIGPALPAHATGRFAVLGPGTGLGVCAVRVDADGRRTVLESEGGHAGFAPDSEEEIAVLTALRRRFGRVSYERLLSGAGLANIYEALGGETLPPEGVTARAAASDPRAAKAIDMFCAVLGGFAGDAALMFGAWDGIYLAGGMLHPLADALQRGGFRRRFESKGRFAALLAEVPTFVIRHPQVGLIGAAAALLRG